MRRIVLPLLSAAALFAAGPQAGDCPLFPADNVWNVRVDHLPLDANSKDYVTAVGVDVKLHPDFGTGYGIPFVVVPEDQPVVPVKFEYAGESDPGPYPVPPDAPIEGGAGSSGDRHVLVIQKGACKLYELFSSSPNADGSWNAGSGAVFHLKSNALRPAGWTSADAAGLPVLPGLVRYEEVAAGEIRHAIRLTIPRTQKTFVWPARHKASTRDFPYPPMGQRFRLRADYDLTKLGPQARVIAAALKRYGLLLADNGSAWYITGAPDSRWDDDDLNTLKRITGADLEAVDESALQAEPDSARVKPELYNPAVLNGASLRPGPVVAGQTVTLRGVGLGPKEGLISIWALLGMSVTSLGGTAVEFDGTRASLLYVQEERVDAVVPAGVAEQTLVEVLRNSEKPLTTKVVVAAAAPGIFVQDATGAGAASVLHGDGSVNAADNPAARGETVRVWVTGFGEATLTDVTARIGGVSATVTYAGASPLAIWGVGEVDIEVPEKAPAGAAVPLLLSVYGRNSQPDVTISIR